MKLEDNKLWHAAREIADYIYSILDNFSEESKWTTVSKLRDRGFDVTSNIAEACGSVDPRDQTHSYALARRDLFSIKNAFIMADSSGEYELNPEIMLKIDGLAASLDEQISKSEGEIQQYLSKFSPKDQA